MAKTRIIPIHIIKGQSIAYTVHERLGLYIRQMASNMPRSGVLGIICARCCNSL